MNPKIISILTALFLTFNAFSQTLDTLTVMQYNLLNYGVTTSSCNQINNNITFKNTQLKTIINYVKPDVFCVNELGVGITPNQNKYADSVLTNVLNTNGVTYYSRAIFTGTSNLSNMLFYNNQKLVLHSQSVISKDFSGSNLVREIDVYRLYYKDPNLATNLDTIFTTFVVGHLKAGSFISDSTKRVKAIAAVMNYLTTNNIDTNVFVMGDFNISSSTDGVFQAATAPLSGFKFNDPINISGDWGVWPNAAFAPYHTQATRKTNTNGGCFVGGGMDDRFDFILASDSVINGSSRVQYINGSYKALGQDGSSYNLDLNTTTNTAVPLNIAQALYNMSDHLPVVLKIKITPLGAGTPPPPAPAATCTVPTSLNATVITMNSASLNWSINTTDTIFEVELVTNNTTPIGSGTITSPNTTMPLSGLLSGTAYDFYTRTICSNPKYAIQITGIYDGPLTGGQPKGIELYVTKNIADLSIYGIGSANNGGGTDGVEFTFPAVTASAGDFIYVTADTVAFRTYMGFGAGYKSGSMAINGDDAVELFKNAIVIDVFGEINVDGTGQPWEYMDGWAYRVNNDTNNLGIFNVAKWNYSSPNATDGCTSNLTCSSKFPQKSFIGTTLDASTWAGPFTFTTLCGGITLNPTTNNMSCNGVSDGNISLTPVGSSNYTYLWSTSATTSSISNLSANNYSVTVYAGLCSVTDSYTITNPTVLSITTSTNTISCFGSSNGSITVTATGGNSSFTYLWSNGVSTTNINNLSTGNYSVTVTSGSCSKIAIATITEPALFPLSVSVTNATTNGGTDGTATAIITGAATTYTYNWNNGNNTQTATNLSASSVIVTVTNVSSGCSQIANGTVSEPNPTSCSISVTLTSNNSSCNGSNDGNITATPMGGTTYTYLWSNNATTATISNLSIGNYSVTVTSGSCTIAANTMISEPTIVISSLNSNNVNCNGGSDGNITAVTTGGTTTNYTYLWSNNATTVAISSLSAGSYSVIVSSASCTATNTTSINEPTLITTTQTLSICNGDSVLIGINYQTQAGVYTITTTAVNTCDSIVTYNLSTTVAASAGIDGSTIICNTQIINLDTVLNGSPNTGGIWTDNNNTGALNGSLFDANNLTPANYDFTYVVSNSTPCGNDSATVAVQVDICNSINELNLNNSSIIYPNPNAGSFILNTAIKFNKLIIKDITGKTVFTTNNNSTKQFDLQLSSGVYFIQMNQGEKQHFEKFIVK